MSGRDAIGESSPGKGGLDFFRSVGVDFSTARQDARDSVFFDEAGAVSFMDEAAMSGVPQSVALSTCNRTEVFFFADDRSADAVVKLFTRMFPAASECSRTHSGKEAFSRLCRIGAGFESAVFGEYQILGQLKAAHALSLASGHSCGELDRIVRAAIACAKNIRTVLDLGATAPSVCRAGMERVAAEFGIKGKSVFVIGSGRTGSLAARLAHEAGASSISICNRDPERARRLAGEIGARMVEYSGRYKAVGESDIVVSATASPHTVVRAGEVSICRKTVFLDLASPRDVDPALASNPFVKIISVDTIAEMASCDKAERERMESVASAAVDEAAAELALSLVRVAAMAGKGAAVCA